ncbi:uncharacterized protein LOC143458686 isoform X1 [Clavelina lepadiformis]|uniref:uncharacterized protein LOC143458686 isoform X1 n=2 Tax=Clavelina lepadiformis TaxID=159417 RepID=UPI00404128EC
MTQKEELVAMGSHVLKGEGPLRNVSQLNVADSPKKCSVLGEGSGLFEYKKNFDKSYLQVGVKRPFMGGSDWSEENWKTETDISFSKNDTLALSVKPFINLLHVPGVQERGILTRFLYYSYTTTSRRTSHYYPSIPYMREKVLSGERVHHAIQKTMCSTENVLQNKHSVSDEKFIETQLQRKAAVVFDEMVATVTSKALKFCGWLFLTILRQLTKSVHLHVGQLNVLRILSEKKIPILYLPLHFSHFDYILLSLVLYHNEIRSPFVASGNNLLIPPFSTIMRRVGGFFIRRKIDNGKDKDFIYRAILHDYVNQLLKENQSLEVFIEGTRTRSGLPNQPKTGLLSVAVDAVENGYVPDVIVVPLCVSYEKLIEGNFDRELMGYRKAPENFFSSIWTIAKMLCGFYGHIRVNFGAPTSMKKTLNEIRSSPSCTFHSTTTASLPRSRSLYEQVMVMEDQTSKSCLEQKSTSTPIMDNASFSLHSKALPPQHLHKMAMPMSSPLLEGTSSKKDNETRELVSLLAERYVYTSMKSKTFMSTNLVAFLLLHKWRCGVSMPVLVKSFRCLITELITRKADIGFSGDYHEVVLHAVYLLGERLVTLDCTTRCNTRSRTSSVASARSKHSTVDSGYEIEEIILMPSPEELGPDYKRNAPEKFAQCSYDSGEELSVESDPSDTRENLSTGLYMTVTADDAVSVDDELMMAPPVKKLFLVEEFNEPSNRDNQSDVCLFVKPSLSIPHVFELSYYANALTPIFALESIAALAVGATTGFRFSILEKQINLPNVGEGKIPVDVDDKGLQTSFLRSALFDKTIELVDILQMDLILCDVTKNLESAVSEVIDSLIASGVLASQEYGISAATKRCETARDLCFDDDEVVQDQWLKVNLPSISQLISIMSVMAGFVEGYVVASSQLTCLLGEAVPETLFKSKILSAVQDRANTGIAIRSECSSSEVVRYAVRSFEWNGIIERYQKDEKQFVLSSDFTDTESIGNLVSRISQFLL